MQLSCAGLFVSAYGLDLEYLVHLTSHNAYMKHLCFRGIDTLKNANASIGISLIVL